MVFQNYALYPHMTVAENMGFALKIAGVGKEERARVLEAAKLLDLEEYLTRKPKALSGGQRQRVAMGRAIVRKPQVFLMDEPLSNLDAKLRVQTRTQIASLQRRLGVTTVYVTHDQTEALTMGDRIAVLKDGLLQQVGTPRDLYEKPNNVFVAGFIGSPAMNLFQVDLASAGGIQFGTAVVDADIDRPTSATQVTAGVRPEDIIVNPADGQGLSVTVDLVEELGADGYLYGHTEIAGKRTDIVARVDGRNHPNAGETVVLAPCRTTCTRSTSSRASASPRRRSPRPDPTRRGAGPVPRTGPAPRHPPRKRRPAWPTPSRSPRAASTPACWRCPGRPLDEWGDTSSRCPRASRHLVRFADLSGRVVAVKETTGEMARREYDMLGSSAASTCRAWNGRGDRRSSHPKGDPLPAALVTAHLKFSLPYRALFTQVLRPDTAGRLVDALAAARAPAHVGFFWGDVSLSNTLFRRDAGAFAAYLVDAETGELHESGLTRGQREHDLDVARTNIAGEIMDLEAGGRLEAAWMPSPSPTASCRRTARCGRR
jgi:multiple sugar transport system ATP-binding protein